MIGGGLCVYFVLFSIFRLLTLCLDNSVFRYYNYLDSEHKTKHLWSWNLPFCLRMPSSASWAVKEFSSDIPEWTSSGEIVLCRGQGWIQNFVHAYLLDLFACYSPGWHQIMFLFLGSFCWEFRYAHHAWADGETCLVGLFLFVLGGFEAGFL